MENYFKNHIPGEHGVFLESKGCEDGQGADDGSVDDEDNDGDDGGDDDGDDGEDKMMMMMVAVGLRPKKSMLPNHQLLIKTLLNKTCFFFSHGLATP